MDIFSWLRRDHAEILGLLGQGRHGEGSGTACAEAWARGFGRWDIHARIEENFLFPLLKGESGLRAPMARAVRTHDRVRACMRGLFDSDRERDPQAWADRAAWLLDTLERLQDMKELRIFPRARDSLSPDDSEELVSEVMDFLHGLQNALAAGR